jgi:hypothetical protein
LPLDAGTHRNTKHVARGPKQERKARERQAKELEESRQAAMKAAKEMRGKSGRELMAQLAALGSELLDDDEVMSTSSSCESLTPKP